MKDHLKDLVKHTYGLGFIDLLKITGTDKATQIDALATDRSVVIQGKFHNVVPEFIGTFGLPNLAKLNTILGIPVYNDEKEKATVDVQRVTKDDEVVPTGVKFSSKSGDFENTYRFMSKGIVNEKLKELLFREPPWDVTVTPSNTSIQKLKFQSQANSEETVFLAKTDGNKLVFSFGDHSSHAGNFVFEQGISGKLTRECAYPIAAVNSILSLDGDKLMKFSSQGLLIITVDSGLGVYNYMLSGQKK